MDIAKLAEPVQSWITSMVESPRLIEERLLWFWHDHFATAIQKVRIPYLLWRQHLTLREHATGSFRELLSAVSTDPAMLLYLDGARNNAEQVNENYAREVMELHTMGTGHYAQTDVTEAAEALTGWVVNIPYAPAAQRFLSDYEPWEAVFIPQRHHPHPVTILGISGRHDPADVLDILLSQRATAEFVFDGTCRHRKATWRNTVTEFSRRQWKPDPHGRLPLCLCHCPGPLARS